MTGPTTPTRNTTPTWYWSTGGGSGNYQYQMDAAGWMPTISLSFTPASALSYGTHTLYVQEKNAAGTWSASASAAVLIKAAPLAPNVSVNATLTNAPQWTWAAAANSGGDGTFAYSLDNAAYSTAQNLARYAPTLSDGSHTLCVEEHDVLGLGAAGCKTLQVDLTAPALAITAPTGMAAVFSGTPATTGTASDANGIKTSTYSLNGGSAQTLTVSNGTWSFAPTWIEGQNILSVTITDNAGNINIQKDTVYKRSHVVFVRKGAIGTGDGTSWANAYPEMSTAFNAWGKNPRGTQVWVAAGTYIPLNGGGLNIDSSIAVYGGFPSDGSANAITMRNVSSYQTDVQDPVNGGNLLYLGGNNITINGFIFEQANSVAVISGSQINIVNCTIRKFTKTNSIPLMITSDGSTLVDSCNFTSNQTTEIGALVGSGFTLSNSQFQNNTSNNIGGYSGGAMQIYGGTVKMFGTVFSQNYGTDPSNSLNNIQVYVYSGTLNYQTGTVYFNEVNNTNSGISTAGGTGVADSY